MAEMRPEEVPAELVRAAMAARWDLAYPDTACRSILAAVLPLHEQQLRAQRDEWHRQNGHLRGERDAATTRAKAAERELAELRATLRPEYGLRYPSKKNGDPDEYLGSASDEATACLLAARGDTIMRRYRTGWEEVPADGQQ